jgi:hypothetical protein
MTIAQTITAAPSAALRIQERLAMTSPLSQMEQAIPLRSGCLRRGRLIRQAFLVSLRTVADLAAVQATPHAGAVHIGGTGFHDPSGFGRLDAVASVEAVVAPQCAGASPCRCGSVDWPR